MTILLVIFTLMMGYRLMLSSWVKSHLFVLTWFDVYFILGYIFVPVMMSGLIETGNSHFLQFNNQEYSVEYAFCVLAVYVITLTTYTVTCQYLGSSSGKYAVSFHIAPKVFLVIGCIGILLYIRAGGGLSQLMQDLYLIRNGRLDIGMLGIVAKKAGYFLIFYYFSILYLYFQGKAGLIHLLFALSLAFFIAYLNGGRGDILNILLFTVLGVYFFKDKFPWVGFAGFLAFFVFYLVFYKQFVALIRGEEVAASTVGLVDIIRKVAIDNYIFMSVSVSIAINSIQDYTYFSSFLQGLLFPFKIIGLVDFDTITRVNTYNILQRDEAFTPPSMVAYFIYSLGYSGIIFGSLIYGIMLGFIQKCYRLLSFQFSAYYVVVIFLIFFVQFLVVNSDFTVFVFRHFLLLFLLFFSFSLRITRADCNEVNQRGESNCI